MLEIAKTARWRNKPSLPMKWLSDNGHLIGEPRLDFGSGRGFDADYFGMDAYDPPREVYPLLLEDNSYKLITCNYVLNVVSPLKQKVIIRKIYDLLHPFGHAYIAVRRDKGQLGKQRFVVLPYRILEENSRFCIYTFTKGVCNA